MPRGFDVLKEAAGSLTAAEEGYGEPGWDRSAREAVQLAYEAVAVEVESDDILVVLPALPRHMWIDMLRLSELRRMAGELEGERLLEAAREAVEIASALLLQALG